MIRQVLVTLVLVSAVLAAAALALPQYRAQLLSNIGLKVDDKSANDTEILTAGNFRVKVSVDPERPRVGRNRLRVEVMDADGNPVSGAQVRALAEMPAMGSMPAMRAPAEFQESTPGVFDGSFELSMAGEWPLAVDVEKQGVGHGDLIFDMATGRKGLKSTTSTPEGIAHYTCSMHPSVKSAAPGSCPICSMDLIPVSKEELSSGAITVDEGRRQRIGVKTAEAAYRLLWEEIRAAGEVTYDTARLTDVSLKFDGWIGALKANYLGQPIKKGEVLLTVYSPKLLAAQEEYLETRRRARNQSLVEAAKQRLSLWDVRAGQIKSLEKRGKPFKYLPILSPAAGTLVEKHIVEGSGVKQGKPLLRIADLSQVWIEARIYEYELPAVSVGMPVIIDLPDLPNEEITGSIDWVDPIVDTKTRTGRIRVVLDNSDGRLRPGMYANVHLIKRYGERLVVPEQAVLYAGDTRVVFLDLGAGRLAPRRITVGRRNGEWIEVLEGLDPGDKVVSSGNFLIAAESKLKSGLDQW